MSVETPWRTTTFAPGLTAPGMANLASLGDGSAKLRYRRSGGQSFFRIVFIMGSTTVLDGGEEFRFVIPAELCSTVDADVSPIWAASALAYDSSTGARVGGAADVIGSNNGGVYPAFAAKATDTSPFTWATDDRLVITAVTEAIDN